MKTQNVAIPELKKGNVVLFYGAKFEILEDAKNVYYNELQLDSNKRPLELQAFGSDAKFISYQDGSGKKGNSLLENYDYFQGNSLAKATIEI